MKNAGKRFQDAAHYFQINEIGKASSLLKTILDVHPNNPSANHLAGLIFGIKGQHNMAARSINRAIEADPLNPVYYSDLGLSLHKAGSLDEALVACEKALQLNSQYLNARKRAADILKDLSRYADALLLYDSVIDANPNLAGTHINRGIVLEALNRHEEALIAYQYALRINPAYAEAYNNAGNAFKSLNRLSDATTAYRKAINIDPDFPAAHYNLSIALVNQGLLMEALGSSKRAIKLQPDNAAAYINLGNIYQELGMTLEAEAAYRDAVSIDPNNSGAFSNLVFLLSAQGITAENREIQELHRRIGLHEINRRPYDWSNRKYGDVSDRLIRIGYVSPDFRKHVVSFFLKPLLENQNHNRFMVFCYDIGTTEPDDVNKQMRNLSDHWRSVSNLTDKELADLVYEDRIDILIDLAGHTANNRLGIFRLKPAPVQVTYLGFFASTGLDTMDYWLTDNILHPSDTPEKPVESIYRLPRCWVCYQPPDVSPAVSPPPSGEDKVTFASFNVLSKISTDLIDAWSTILNNSPGSNLLIMGSPFNEPATCQLYRDRFSRHGIDLDRLLLRGSVPFKDYLSIYAEVDIVLDTFPRTGGTTTAEALWMGVPVITLAGNCYVERISASKLAAVGLEKLIAYNRDEYIEKAIVLSRDPTERARLRPILRDMMASSALCNGKELASAVETAYIDMLSRL